MIAAEVTPAQIAEWRRTRYPYKLAAAEIAEWARRQERGTAVPGNEFFAGNLGIVASKSTWVRARTFLAGRGVITPEGGPYMVA
jgi:hypothetical protein